MSGTTSGSSVPAAAVSGQGRRDLRLLCLGVAGMTTATALVGLSVALHLRPVGSWAVAAGLAATILAAATGALWAGPLVDRPRTKPLVALAAAISSLAEVLGVRTTLLIGAGSLAGLAAVVLTLRGDRRPAAPGQGLDRSATAGLRLVGETWCCGSPWRGWRWCSSAR